MVPSTQDYRRILFHQTEVFGIGEGRECRFIKDESVHSHFL